MFKTKIFFVTTCSNYNLKNKKIVFRGMGLINFIQAFKIRHNLSNIGKDLCLEAIVDLPLAKNRLTATSYSRRENY